MTKEEAMLLEDAVNGAKSAHRRLDHLEEEVGNLQDLTKAVAVTATNVERLQTDVKEMKDDVKALAAAPAKKWDAAIGYVMAALISGIVGMVLGLVFK